MAQFEETRKFCQSCNRNVIAKRKGTNHILHLLLTVLTAGFWLIIWIGSSIKAGGWYCGACGDRALRGAR
jgi:hypothetical protein